VSDKSGISWTNATWNPVTGCKEVSPGCDHCYAKTFSERWRGTPGHHFEHGFDLQLRPERLGQPLRWKRPRMIFVNSMSDLFHAEIPETFILQVFSVMQRAEQHTFQVLTKRHARMRSLMPWIGRKLTENGERWPLPNVWLGVSVEDQKWAAIRIPSLLETRAAVRFLSCEPLLGPLDLIPFLLSPAKYPVPLVTGLSTDAREVMVRYPSPIGWVIVGGESGPGARPMQAGWLHSLQKQCQSAGVPFFAKQLGNELAREWGVPGKGDKPADWPVELPQQFPGLQPERR
jgi:protein gp37